jgi:hypothetical protein
MISDKFIAKIYINLCLLVYVILNQIMIKNNYFQSILKFYR